MQKYIIIFFVTAVITAIIFSGVTFLWQQNRINKIASNYATQNQELIKQTTDCENTKINEAQKQKECEAKIQGFENQLQVPYCINNLESFYIRERFTSWKSIIVELYPEHELIFLGSYCKLTDGKQIISISYQNGERDHGRKIILFDDKNNKLKETIGSLKFWCPIVGEPAPPSFPNIQDDIVEFKCGWADGSFVEIFTNTLNLDTFEINQ